MTEDEARRLIERYRSSVAFGTPGKPFGWSIVMFKDRFKRRLIERGVDPMRAYFRAERAYERVMRYVPTFANYCRAQSVLRPIAAASPTFTDDELQHMIDLFTDANDPVSRAIAIKAAAMLQR